MTGGRVRKLRRAPERGAATIEQLGTVVIVALLFAAALLGFSTYGPRLEQALCQLATGIGVSAGSCDGVTVPQATDGPTDEDFRPPVCMLQENSTQTNAEVKIAFVTIGDNAGFVVQEFSDGTVQVTATDGGSLGAEGGVGGSIGGKDSGLGASLDFGGGVTFDAGDTWKFDSMDQWEAMEGDLNAYLAQQVQIQNAGEGAAGLHLWLWLSDGYLDPPRAPEQTTTTIGWEAAVEGQLGARYNVPGQDGKDDTLLDLNMGLYGEGEIGGDVVFTQNSETGETSKTYGFTMSGEAGVNALILDGGAAGEVKGAYKVTEDAKGNIISVEFMRESAGGIDLEMGVGTPGGMDNGGNVGLTGGQDERTILTTTIDVTEENRDVVESWLGASNANALGGGGVLISPNLFDPSVPAQDPFSQLLYEEGLHSRQVYENVSDGWSFGLEFALGLKFGASFGNEETETTIQQAGFLGAPGTDGVRPMVPDETCVLE